MTAPPNPYRLVAPVPGEWETRIVPSPNGGNHILVTIIGPTGAFVQVMSPESAIEVGLNLTNSGKQAKSGLILPPSAMNGGGS